MSKTTAPTHLKRATKIWFNQILKDYELESHHTKILILAATAWDRAQEAREIIEAQGAIVNDRFGQPRKNPACDLERDSMTSFSKLIRELCLDIEPPKAPGRPPGLY